MAFTGTVNTEGTHFTEEVVVSEKIELVKKLWASFHNAIIIALLFTLLGVAIGVKVSKDFYVNRLDEVTQTGAMLHGKKVYVISLKQ